MPGHPVYSPLPVGLCSPCPVPVPFRWCLPAAPSAPTPALDLSAFLIRIPCPSVSYPASLTALWERVAPAGQAHPLVPWCDCGGHCLLRSRVTSALRLLVTSAACLHFWARHFCCLMSSSCSHSCQSLRHAMASVRHCAHSSTVALVAAAPILFQTVVVVCPLLDTLSTLRWTAHRRHASSSS